MTTTATPPSSRRRTLLIVGLVAAVALAAVIVWYLTREAPGEVDTQAAIDAAAGEAEEADEDAGGTQQDAGGDAAADADSGATGDGAALPAEWQVVTDAVEYDLAAGTGTFVGFRIAEELTTVGDTEAVGRTPAVEGTVSLDGTTLVDASIVADLTALTTDIRQRDGATQRALNTSTEPTTSFTLTEPAELGTDPVVGEPIAVEVTGELTLNGVTQPVTASLEAVLLDGAADLLLTGSFPLTLADHDLVAPSAPVVVSVADTATVELQLYLDAA